MEEKTANQERKAYEQEMEKQLEAREAEIEQLRAEAAKAEAKAKLKIYEQIEDLLNKRNEVKQRLQELKATGEGAWKDVRGGVEAAYRDLKVALSSALSRLKGRE